MQLQHAESEFHTHFFWISTFCSLRPHEVGQNSKKVPKIASIYIVLHRGVNCARNPINSYFTQLSHAESEFHTRFVWVSIFCPLHPHQVGPNSKKVLKFAWIYIALQRGLTCGRNPIHSYFTQLHHTESDFHTHSLWISIVWLLYPQQVGPEFQKNYQKSHEFTFRGG